ncbi:MAG: NUDIX hydrolase [Nitratireductor sp.]|nr:NUDIX hydrolase [Nitratireductor sp.]
MIENLSLLFRRPRRLQVAALCYRKGSSGPEVLLVTTRDTRRWIIPKGWPMTRRSARKTAEIEAYEEAGIVGKAAREPIGKFHSHKGMGEGLKLPTEVLVFPVKVKSVKRKYPERDERDLIWLPLESAIRQTNEDGLRALLQSESVEKLLKSA